MAQKTIELKVKTDTSSSVKTLGQLESELEDINQQLKDVEPNSEAFADLSKRAQDATRQIDDLNKEIEGFTFEDKIQAADGAAKLFAGSLETVVGSLGLLGFESEALGEFERKAASAIAVGLGIKDVAEGVGQLAPLFKNAGKGATIFGISTRKALIATGIGAFVVALGTIIAYWDDISVAIGLSVDESKKFTDELEDQSTLVEGQLGVLESQKTVLEARGEDTLQLNKNLLQQLEIQIGITEQLIAQKTLQLEQEKEENRQIDFWEKLKIGALQYFGAYGKAGLATADALQAEDDETIEKQNEIFDLQVKLNQLKVKQIGLEGEVNTQIEERAPREEVQTVGEIEAKGVALMGLGELEVNILDATTLATMRKTKADKDAAQAAEDAIELEYAKMEALYATGEALGALGGVIGEETRAGKALASAQALINTYLGVTEVLKQKSTLPSPFDVIVKVANVATILATGLAAVRNINATQVNESGGGQSPRGIPTRGASVAATPTVQTPTGQQLDVADATSREQEPIRAYVIAGEVTSAQEANARITQRRVVGRN